MFPIRLFGYDRVEVEQRLTELETQLQQLASALSSSQEQVTALQAELEDCSIRLAAARRDRLQALSDSKTMPANTVIVMGPITTFAALAELADELENSSDLSIQFRIYRDGLYRVDAWVEDMSSLITWFRNQPLVCEVNFEDNTLHVTVREGV